jgi:hypothetical protein
MIRTKRSLQFAVTLLTVCMAFASCGGGGQTATTRAYSDVQQSASPTSQRRGVTSGAATIVPPDIRTNIGFTTRKQFNEHFAKHGSEFDGISKDEYLLQAQTLRDEPAGGNVLELRRPDGTVSRYDRKSGAFIAFDADGIIRTFFKPNNGESYFRRQALRSH